MNILYRIYFFLPNFNFLGKLGKGINRLIGFFLKLFFDLWVPRYLWYTRNSVGYGLNKMPRDEYYIVSLTSFPARIDNIWITIECLLRQSFKPDRVILWLAEEQFPDKNLPDRLLQLQSRGLTIVYCEDLRSHKKYYYSIKEYPKANIITFDDDLYYDNKVIENLIDLHREFPGNIVTNRAHRIRFSKQNEVLPYRRWQHNISDKKPSKFIVPTGGAGTLYPPLTLHEEILNKSIFMEICKYADDIWLKIMSLRQGTDVSTNSRYNKDFCTVLNTQEEKLVNMNVISGGNDVQIRAICEYYNINLSPLVRGDSKKA